PCHNGAAHTAACLAALEETLPGNFRGEVLVVDDASTDGTPALLEGRSRKQPRLKVLRNCANEGFIRSCNRAARAASGDVLVFLNNDTIPLPGWLPPLPRLFQARPEAGVVGGMLLYPDGRLQEAGGVIFSDGSGANFGRGDCHPDHPLYNYVRAVDY